MINPSSPPLLTINAPIGLASWLPQSGAIASLGRINAGRDVLLAAQNLNVEGQVQAEGAVSLLASESLTATDTATQPLFISAAGDLLLQGNQSLSVDALSHPDSGVFSGQDMLLRSDTPILGDAVFSSGGRFSAERLDGSLASVISPKDPVFETAGDFAIADFSGGSLQIIAGGRVTIPGTVEITTAGGPFNDSIVTLSNGDSVSVTGTTVPTLDIRAGTTAFFNTPAAGTGTSADISIGSIVVPGGLVLLTNQYQPNLNLDGNINVGTVFTSSPTGGGDVIIDSRGGISFNRIDTSSVDVTTIENLPVSILLGFFAALISPDSFVGGDGGEVNLLADGAIQMPFPSGISSYGLTGGAISLESSSSIVQADGPLDIEDSFLLSTVENGSLGTNNGSPILFSAPIVQLGGNFFTVAAGSGRGGNIIGQGDSLTLNQATVTPVTVSSGSSGNLSMDFNRITLNRASQLGTLSVSDAGGNAGNVDIQSNRLRAQGGSQILSTAVVLGDAGNISVTAQDIVLSGFRPNGSEFSPSGILNSSQGGAIGNSGAINVTTNTLSILDGATIGTSSFGIGNAGSIRIDAAQSIILDGAVFFAGDSDSHPSGITGEIFTNAVGNGGEIVVNTPVLSVTNGGTITSSVGGDGRAGNVTLNVTESATFDGVVRFTNQGVQDRISSASVETTASATGPGGTLTINAPNLTLTNGAQLQATTGGVGDAGDIVLNIRDELNLSGEESGILANTFAGSSGNGGSIFIDPALIAVQDGARISVSSEGTGEAGNIVIEGGSLILDRGTISAETLSSTGGNITLNIKDVVLLLNNSRISATAGTALAGGDGGNVNITTTYLIGSPNDGNNDITANAFSGAGGNVLITADGIFGIAPLSRAELETLLGTSDPALLDPANLSSNDITAISQENPNLQGQVDIQSPDTDPSQGIVALPEDIVDASRLIAQGCASDGLLAQEIGSLVVIGRGGLPASPSANQNSRQLLLDWATVETESGSNAASTIPDPPESTGTTIGATGATGATIPHQLQEVQSLALGADGQVVLLAQSTGGAGSSAWLPTMTCAGTVEEN